MLFIFDLEIESDDSANFDNLIYNQNSIINLVKLNIFIMGNIFYSVEIIHYPILNHYTATIFNINENPILKNHTIYYYNDIEINNLIEEIKINNGVNNIIKILSKNNIYIPIYSKN